MTRAYTARNRQLVPIAISVVKPDHGQIELLAAHFYKEALTDGGDILKAARMFKEWDMADTLVRELRELPGSPVSMEIKRMLRQLSKERAKQVAAEILIQD